jgi:hypothetical protein
VSGHAYCVIKPGAMGDSSATRVAKMRACTAAGIIYASAGASWSTLQPSAGGAVDVTALRAYLDDAATVGLKVIVRISLQYPPPFVAANVEQFRDQSGNLWSDTGASGNNVRNWQWTAQGRTYIADLFTKLGATGIASHPAVLGASLGGGYAGEAHYAPIVTSPMQWWIYGASLQTGAGLAGDQVACPHPGRTPLFNGTNDAFDHDIANWWLNGMTTFVLWFIAQHKAAGFGGAGRDLWVLHPSTGVRARPHSDAAWIGEVARGVDPRRLMSAYAHDIKVWPWSTWDDYEGGSATETGAGSGAYLLELARQYGKQGKWVGENTHTTSSPSGCVATMTGTSADSIAGAAGWMQNWLSYDSLAGGAAGDATLAQYAAAIAANP